MDPSGYKDLKTSRGYVYHYFASAPEEDKPTLLLLHGFPSMSLDWMHVVSFFKNEGFGIIAPDLLGYAGTDKPTDPAAYRMKLMTADIIEILNAEIAKKVISIAHDWGCVLNSRLANYYEERFEAFGFFAIAYFPPQPDFNIDVLNAVSKEKLGYTHFGYWKFFEKEDAAKIIEEHFDSFATLGFCKDPNVMRNNFCAEGALEKWLVADQMTEVAPHISEDIRKMGKAILLQGGLAAPLCWYKAYLHGHTPKDDAEIPKNYVINKPAFFGAALNDPTGPVEVTKPIMSAFAQKCTVVDFETDHWVLHAAPDKVNTELLKWIQGLSP